jgi:hypothetical protein
MYELDKTKCRICRRPATANMDPDWGYLPVCAHHEKYLDEALLDFWNKHPQDRLVGFGLALETINPDQPDDTHVRCDKVPLKDGHLWIGSVSAPCMTCLVLYVEMIVEDRKRILSPLEMDPENIGYEKCVAQRGKDLKRYIEIGLISRDEALSMFDRLVRNV